MNPRHPLTAACCFAATVLSANALAGGELVGFPDEYANGVHYATVNRGEIREELFASPVAIQAVKSGKPIPSGTVITLVDYRDGRLFRYVVMEKRTGWGSISVARKAWRRGEPGAYSPASLNSLSRRRRLTPRSLLPTREALRAWSKPAAGS